MRTSEIMEVFGIHSHIPSKVLRNDKEILDFVRNCVSLQGVFNSEFKESCEDAVSRDAVLDACSQSINILDAMSRIEDLPSAASKQRTGHWIRKTNDYGASSYMCSECGCWHPTHNHSLGFDYCNGCGARMVEPQESEEISREEIAALLASGSENPNKCEDAISRQAAHEAVYSANGLAGAMKNIDSLPPVTPKQRTGESEVNAVLDKIRAEIHATAELHEDGDYYLRDEWIDEIFDKYKAESEEQA